MKCILVAFCMLAVSSARAQGTVSPPATMTITTTPKQADYDAAAPNNVSAATSNFNVTHTCTTTGMNNGCSVFIRAQSAAYSVQALLVSVQETNQGSCSRGTSFPDATTWVDLTAAPTRVFTTSQRQNNCSATMRLRFVALDWTKHISTGPSGPTVHTQPVEFSVVGN